MLKKIKIKVNSHIENLDAYGLADGDAEVSENAYDGFMRITGNEIKLSYKDNTESGTVASDILIRDGKVTVARTGAIVSTMYFSENEEYKTVYELVPYKFDMTLKTKRIRNCISDSGGELSIIYAMDVGGAEKKCRMNISVSEVKIG